MKWPKNIRLSANRSRRALPPAAMLLAPMLAGIALGSAFVLHACLPADDRPIPGTLSMSVTPSPATLGGFTTSDGYAIKFERVLVGIGGTSLSDTCTSYSEANYDRVLDLRSANPQKLSVLFGIGACDLRYRIGPPSADAILGARAQESDKSRMRTPGKDAYTERSGIALEVSGAAQKDGVAFQFAFAFRQRVRFDRCRAEVGDAGGANPQPDAASANANSITLRGDEAQVINIRMEAEALFRDDAISTTPNFRFAPFAAADANRDGIITLEELRAVPVAMLTDAGPFETQLSSPDDAGTQRPSAKYKIESVADYMYVILMPLIPRFRDDQRCRTSVQGVIDAGGGRGPN
jgi:hypothetical protein